MFPPSGPARPGPSASGARRRQAPGGAAAAHAAARRRREEEAAAEAEAAAALRAAEARLRDLSRSLDAALRPAGKDRPAGQPALPAG